MYIHTSFPFKPICSLARQGARRGPFPRIQAQRSRPAGTRTATARLAAQRWPDGGKAFTMASSPQLLALPERRQVCHGRLRHGGYRAPCRGTRGSVGLLHRPAQAVPGAACTRRLRGTGQKQAREAAVRVEKKPHKPPGKVLSASSCRHVLTDQGRVPARQHTIALQAAWRRPFASTRGRTETLSKAFSLPARKVPLSSGKGQ